MSQTNAERHCRVFIGTETVALGGEEFVTNAASSSCHTKKETEKQLGFFLENIIWDSQTSPCNYTVPIV